MCFLVNAFSHEGLNVSYMGACEIHRKLNMLEFFSSHCAHKFVPYVHKLCTVILCWSADDIDLYVDIWDVLDYMQA